MKLPVWLGHIAAAILSFLAAFFATFNVLFSDVFGFKGMAGAVVYVFVVYLVISLIVHWLWRTTTRTWVGWLVLPGGLFALYITIMDHNRPIYTLFVLAAVVGGSWLGRFVLRRKVVLSPNNSQLTT